MHTQAPQLWKPANALAFPTGQRIPRKNRLEAVILTPDDYASTYAPPADALTPLPELANCYFDPSMHQPIAPTIEEAKRLADFLKSLDPTRQWGVYNTFDCPTPDEIIEVYPVCHPWCDDMSEYPDITCYYTTE